MKENSPDVSLDEYFDFDAELSTAKTDINDYALGWRQQACVKCTDKVIHQLSINEEVISDESEDMSPKRIGWKTIAISGGVTQTLKSFTINEKKCFLPAWRSEITLKALYYQNVMILPWKYNSDFYRTYSLIIFIKRITHLDSTIYGANYVSYKGIFRSQSNIDNVSFLRKLLTAFSR